MAVFTALINNKTIPLNHFSGTPCANLLQAREATKRIMLSDEYDNAEVFKNGESKGRIKVNTRYFDAESHNTTFTYTGSL